jgi:hypothetical protein
MFKPLSNDSGPMVPVTINGAPFFVRSGISVAAALLCCADGGTRTTPVSGAPRAPYCLMGACFECLVEIDGIPNRQACMIAVAAGMHIDSPSGARTVRL